MKKTDMKLAKRLSKLYGEFNKMWKSRRCEGCELEAFGKYGVCDHAWVWKKMREEKVRAKVTAAPNESPKAKEPIDPNWCKEGQWVMTPSGSVAQISVVGTLGATVQFRDCSLEFLIDDLKPVCFRPYESLEELEPLLGKTLRFKREATGSVAVETITAVEYDTFSYGRINLRQYAFYAKEAESTIDGLPIGVPVVGRGSRKEGDE